jgi:hypothetical protein
MELLNVHFIVENPLYQTLILQSGFIFSPVYPEIDLKVKTVTLN